MRSRDNNLPYEILTLSHFGFKYLPRWKEYLRYPKMRKSSLEFRLKSLRQYKALCFSQICNILRIVITKLFFVKKSNFVWFLNCLFFSNKWFRSISYFISVFWFFRFVYILSRWRLRDSIKKVPFQVNLQTKIFQLAAARTLLAAK